MKALGEAHINVKNKPIELQIDEIMDHLAKILPLKIEKKKVKLERNLSGIVGMKKMPL